VSPGVDRELLPPIGPGTVVLGFHRTAVVILELRLIIL